MLGVVRVTGLSLLYDSGVIVGLNDRRKRVNQRYEPIVAFRDAGGAAHLSSSTAELLREPPINRLFWPGATVCCCNLALSAEIRQFLIEVRILSGAPSLAP